ncbi:hypothetical protein [Oceanobacillus halotolerans]|uniref:hypothetical protein n=1 Tax=Oceanobacillus halotolerans TaxID=2663380 RepID=UPI0013D9CE2B|nr:hypothetical protein [Oceanobacillus halotolerans]
MKIESKIDVLEKRVAELERSNKSLYDQLRAMQLDMEEMMQTNILTSQRSSASTSQKVEYLTEVNEEMFQQNVRLREFIEDCIEAEVVPTRQQYYDMLRQDR